MNFVDFSLKIGKHRCNKLIHIFGSKRILLHCHSFQFSTQFAVACGEKKSIELISNIECSPKIECKKVAKNFISIHQIRFFYIFFCHLIFFVYFIFVKCEILFHKSIFTLSVHRFCCRLYAFDLKIKYVIN